MMKHPSIRHIFVLTLLLSATATAWARGTGARWLADVTKSKPYAIVEFLYYDDEGLDSFWNNDPTLYVNGENMGAWDDLDSSTSTGDRSTMSVSAHYVAILFNKYKTGSQYWAKFAIFSKDNMYQGFSVYLEGPWTNDRKKKGTLTTSTIYCAGVWTGYNLTDVKLEHAGIDKEKITVTYPNLYPETGVSYSYTLKVTAANATRQTTQTYETEINTISDSRETSIPGVHSSQTTFTVTPTLHATVALRCGNTTRYVTMDQPASIKRATTEPLPYARDLTVVPDMWQKIVTLNWSEQSTDIDGKWYIYRKADGNTAFLGTVSKSGHKFKDADDALEFEKDYTYYVCFYPNAWKVDAATTGPHNYSASKTTAITRECNIDVAALPEEDQIRVSWTHKAAPTSDYYSQQPVVVVERKINTANEWREVANVPITKSGTVSGEYIDTDVLGECVLYTYRVSLRAVQKTFTSREVSQRISGETQLTGFVATKGSFASEAHLTWTVRQVGTANTVFVVWRRAVGGDTWSRVYTTEGTDATYYYVDNSCDAGVYYEYKITCYTPCDGDRLEKNSLYSYGFSRSSGVISGRVTYGTGVAVPGVRINLEKSTVEDVSDNLFRSVRIQGTDSRVAVPVKNVDGDDECLNRSTILADGKAITVAMWIYNDITDSLDSGDERFYDLCGFRCADYMAGLGIYHGIYADYLVPASSDRSYMSYAQPIPRQQWVYVVLTVDKSGFLWYSLVSDGKVSRGESSLSLDKNKLTDDAFFYVGNYSPKKVRPFTGNVDEVRIWSKELTAEEILTTYDRMLSGTEKGLALYWPMDEGVEMNYVFDLSQSNNVPNNAHGIMTSATISANTPSADQFRLYGLTDASGNYVIEGVPFTGRGINYTITPQYGIHQFQAAHLTRYVSPTSLVHSGVDFTDISSFPVHGKIRYAGTDYPVDSCKFAVDGTPCMRDGDAVTSDRNGEYTIDVPIGKHYITVSLGGHTFVGGGRYPTTGTETFTQEVFNLDFEDSTLVNVTGRFVGGDLQQDLPLGFGQTVGNLGTVAFTLEPINSDYRLNVQRQVEGTVVQYVDNPNPVAVASQTPNIVSQSWRGAGAESRYIYIETQSATGEFSAMVPPLQYKVGIPKVKATGLEVGQSITINATDVNRLSADTLVTEAGKETYPYKVKLNTPYHSRATFSVTSTNDVPEAFGEEVYDGHDQQGSFTVTDIFTTREDAAGKTQVSYTYGHPVFVGGNTYIMRVHAYETYTNADTGREFIVPLDGKVVTIHNELSSDQTIAIQGGTTAEGKEIQQGEVIDLKDNQLQLDSLGKATYRWQAGLPNLNADMGYARNFSMDYEIDGNTFTWEGFSGVVFGSIGSGSNFVTAGPDKVHMILRDPPGANSFATWTKGSTIVSKTVSKKTSIHNVTDIAQHQFGYKEAFIVGTLVAGTITEAKSKDDMELGLEVSLTHYTGTSDETTLTTTRDISTSNDPEYVGSRGDVFIGTSTNYLFGKAREVDFVREGGKVRIGDREVTQMGEQIKTTFNFTQHYVENILFPNYENIKKNYLTYVSTMQERQAYANATDHVVYVTTLKPGDRGYGTCNFDKSVWGSEAADSLAWEGPSYRAILPVGSADKVFDDSIVWCNQQRKLWEHYLAMNEKEKVDLYESRNDKEYANYYENISFDGGAQVENSVRHESAHTDLHGHDNHEYVIFNNKWGFSIKGFGVVNSLNTANGGHQIEDYENTKTNFNGFSYTLKDRTWAAHTVDVYSKSNYSPVFRTRAGQTYGPYEDEEQTKYYQKGTSIGAATAQLEKPQLDVEHPSVSGIPNGGTATYTIKLSNQSDAQCDCIFDLCVYTTTNPHGAVLLLDGAPLVQSRSIVIPYGQSFTKTLQLRQSDLSVLDYNDIEIALMSQSQNDPTSSWPVIASTQKISAHFVPSSSPVVLGAAGTVLNTRTGANLSLTISGFDKNYYNLKAFRLQYRQANDPEWTQIKEWSLADIQQSEDGTLHYDLDMSDFSDGNYAFRVVSVSTYGTGEVTVTSDEVSVVKDMRRPQILGLPEPADGILGVGDVISVKFNEDIRNGNLTADKNFLVTGALNGAEVDHAVAFQSSGRQEYVAFTSNFSMRDRDFTYEFWAMRQDDGDGILVAHGTEQNYFSIGYTDGHLSVDISDENYTSDKAVAPGEWAFYSVSYRRQDDGGLLSLVVAYENVTDTIFSNLHVRSCKTTGALAICRNFVGAIHDLAIWNHVRSISKSLSERSQQKSPLTEGIVAYWKMDEGHGTTITESARGLDMRIYNGGWYLNNTNFAAALHGGTGISIPMATRSIEANQSYAVEFWFMREKEAVSILLESDQMAIVCDSLGHIILVDADLQTKVSTETASTGQWHHLALNVQRGVSAIVWLDGQNILSTNDSFVPALQGAEVHFGMSLEGAMDEIRIWKATLSRKYMVDNRYNRVDTAEAHGLIAYYPMERTSLNAFNQVETRFSLADASQVAGGDATSDEAMQATTTPPLKPAPQVTNLPFSFTASEREIFITLTNDAARLEGTTVNFTIQKVMDLNGSESEPVTWTAYIRQNELAWGAKTLPLYGSVGDEGYGCITIYNNGGTSHEYTIAGLPSWLTVTPSSGTLAPKDEQTLEFVISSAVAVGSYEETIYLRGEDGISEPLTVTLTVTGSMPYWDVNAADYEFSMPITGQLYFGKAISEEAYDFVYAFIDGECRGMAPVSYVDTRSGFYVQMLVYGHASDVGKDVVFKGYDSSNALVYSPLQTYVKDKETDILFSNVTAGVGTFDAPVRFQSAGSVEQTVNLSPGWNWVSFYVDPTNTLISSIMQSYVEAIEIVKSKTRFTKSDGTQFAGDLLELGGATMYKILARADVELSIVGPIIERNVGRQRIRPQWNWLGNPFYSNRSITKAFAGAEGLTADDQIISLSDFAIWNGKLWEGNLKNFEPGRGHLYYSNNETAYYVFENLVNTTGAVKAEVTVPDDENGAQVGPYKPVPDNRYPSNMNVIARLYLDGAVVDTAAVAVFTDEGDCLTATRGIDGYYFITIPGDGAQDISFHACVDGHDVPLAAGESGRTMRYANDAMLGDLATPVVLSNSETGVENVDGSTMLSNPIGSCYDLAGRKLTPTSPAELRRGVYIVGGRKMLK